MAGFLYYFPGDRGVKPSDELLKELELNHLIGNIGLVRGLGAGPDRAEGSICATKNSKTNCLFKIEKQKWMKCLKAKFWIGVEKDNKPKPEDLKKDRMIEGHEVTLSDGNKWVVPVARVFDTLCDIGEFLELTILPKRLRRNSDDEIKQVIVEAFEVFAQDAEDIYNDFLVDTKMDESLEAKVTTIERRLEICERAVGINYNVSRWELSFLEVFDTANLLLVCRAVIDYILLEQQLLEMSKEKKTEDLISDGSDILDTKEAS